MKLLKLLALVGGLSLGFTFGGGTSEAEAGYYYGGGWRYHNTYRYYYNTYHYAPQRYHHCIYYPQQRYVYYYNPYQKVYWGRFDLEGKEGAQYSELKDADKKGVLKDIPEEAFPKPAAMPANPEGVAGTIDVPPAPPKEAPPATEAPPAKEAPPAQE